LAFYFTVADGSIQLHSGRAQDPAATVTTDEETWADVASGTITEASAIASGAMKLTGDRKAVARLRRIFSRKQVLAQADATIEAARTSSRP
jgi:putative sterol carrier protein